jgi:hypothetical protein
MDNTYIKKSRFLLAHLYSSLNLDNSVRVMTRVRAGLQNIHTGSGVHPDFTYSVGTNGVSLPMDKAPGAC